MKEVELETRLVRKNRQCWMLVFFWALVLGVFYHLCTPTNLSGLTTYFVTVIVLSIVYTTIGELATKIMYTFWRRSVIVYPLGSVVAYLLSYISPRYAYPPEPYGIYVTAMLYGILMVFCFFASSVATIITRLVSGYEAFCEEPVVESYLITGKIGEITTIVESFLKSLNIEFTTTVREPQRAIKFYNGSNEYSLFLNPITDDSMEVNFVILRWKRETLVEPSKEDLDMFLVYLESFLDKRKEAGKIDEWTSSFKSRHVETMKIRVWKDYTSPLQIKEKVALRGLITQKISGFYASHKKGIFTFIGGVLTVVVGDLLIRYITHIMRIW